MFNATFNNISVILWQSILLVKETGENQTSHSQTLYLISHNVVSSTPFYPHNVDGIVKVIRFTFYT
jgi:hypothetical protein